jgi:hypothetical protein
MLDSPRRKEWS